MRCVNGACRIRDYGCCVVSETASRGIPKVLKPYYLTHRIVSCFVGFLRVGRVEDGFARHLLCRIDVTIAMMYLTALRDHWRKKGHLPSEIRCRLQKCWTLYNRDCREALAAE